MHWLLNFFGIITLVTPKESNNSALLLYLLSVLGFSPENTSIMKSPIQYKSNACQLLKIILLLAFSDLLSKLLFNLLFCFLYCFIAFIKNYGI